MVEILKSHEKTVGKDNAEKFIKLQMPVMAAWVKNQERAGVSNRAALEAWVSGPNDMFRTFVEQKGGPNMLESQTPDAILADFLAWESSPDHRKTA